MPRPLRVLLTGVAFLAFTLGGAALGWFLLPFSRAGGRSPRAQRRRAHEVLFGGYRAFVSLLRLLGLIAHRPPRVDVPPGPYVLVANHPSLIDVMLLLGTFRGVVCLVKASWFRSPFIAPLLRQGGYIPGPSDEDDDGAPVLARIVETLRAGFPVLVFPEGSRSPPGGLRRFKVGAVLAARQAGVPLIPVVIHASPPTLLKGQAWYEVPDRAVTYAIERLPHEPSLADDPREAARTLRRRYAEALAIADPRDPDEATVRNLHAEGRHGAIP